MTDCEHGETRTTDTGATERCIGGVWVAMPTKSVGPGPLYPGQFVLLEEDALPQLEAAVRDPNRTVIVKVIDVSSSDEVEN